MQQYFFKFHWTRLNVWRLRPLRAIPLLLIVIILLSSITLLASRQQPAAAAPTLTGAGLDCINSPFGNVLDLYPEKEVFVGSTSSHPSFPLIPAFTLDLNAISGNLNETNLIDTPNAIGVSAHTAVAADLNGDGETEFVQTFVSSSGVYYVSRYNADETIASYQLSTAPHTKLAAAAGDILGENREREQVVMVSVNQNTGALTAAVWSGPDNGSVEAVWRTTLDNRANATLVDVAIGSLNSNRKDDIVLAFRDTSGSLQLVALEYDSAHLSGNSSSPNYQYRLAEIGKWSSGVGTPMDVQVTTARLNNDFLDEIVLGYDQDEPSSNLSPQIHLRVLYLANGKLNEQPSMQYTVQATESYNFALASGDVNGNFRQEVVVTYDSNGGAAGNGLAAKVLHGQGLNTTLPTLSLYGDWFIPWSTERDEAQRLDTAVNDLNRDGYAEIVLSLDDGRGLEILYIDHDLLGTNTLPLGHWVNLDPTNLTGTTALALGDQDNDTLKGVFAPNAGTSGDCRPITERRITAAIFTPPYWENIQLPQNSRGAIGRSVNQNQSQESAYMTERSHTLSGYIGAGVSGEYGPLSFESNVRFTAEESFSQGFTSGSGVYTSTTEFIQTYDENPFVTFEESYYDCYNYEVQDGGMPVTDATAVRNCEYLETIKGSAALPSWETTYGPLSNAVGANEALSWSPLVRDWASLALFRRDFVSQSSGSNATLAIDGNLSGVPADMTTTLQENNPWWEVDLGQSKTLTKIRLWGLEERSACQDRLSCPAMLADVYVFISDTPFASSDPAVLLNDPNVHHTSLADISPALPTITTIFPTGRVTTFQTLDATLLPVNGRYIRVQIVRDNAILSLAEVQVFGANHVEPDRYPVDVRDPLAADGFFQVQLYDPYEINLNEQFKWIDVRGKLLWHRDAPVNHLIGPGGTTVEWALSQETGSNQFSTHSESHSTAVGVEFDLTAGVLAQVQVGGGAQFSTGITQEDSFRTSWGETFNLGGYVEGFPSEYGEPTWLLDCRYRVRPYFYELTEESTFGVTTGFNMLDYTVPVNAPTDLDRTADLQNCLNGNQANNEPVTAPDSFGMVTGSSITMSVLGNDLGNNLKITTVSQPLHGTITHDARTITYTPEPGYVGSDSFTYTVSDGTTTSTGTVTVNITMRQLFLPFVIR